MNQNELWDIEDELMADVQPVRMKRKTKVTVNLTNNRGSMRRVRKLKLINTTETEMMERNN